LLYLHQILTMPMPDRRILLALLVCLPFFLPGQSRDSLLCGHPDIKDSFDSLHKRYHHYRVSHVLLDKEEARELSDGRALELMCSNIHFTAPFPKKKKGELIPCQEINVKIGFTRKNPIISCVDTAGLRLINYSLPGHLLHPGKVVRSISRQEGRLMVITESWGEGRLPKANEKRAEKTWGAVDERLRKALKEEVNTQASGL